MIINDNYIVHILHLTLAGLIISYEVRVNQNNILVGPFTASTTWYTVSGLACCQNYDFEVSAATSQGFGPSRSHNMGFRTLADLSSKIVLIKLCKYYMLQETANADAINYICIIYSIVHGRMCNIFYL